MGTESIFSDITSKIDKLSSDMAILTEAIDQIQSNIGKLERDLKK